MGRACLRVSPELFVEVLKEGPRFTYEVTKDALPADTRFIECRTDRPGFPDVLYLILESDAWDTSDVGAPIPELPPPLITLYHDQLRGKGPA